MFTRVRGGIFWAVLVAATWLAWLPAAVLADEGPISPRLVPADCGFFVVYHGLGELWAEAAQSRAATRLRELKVAERFWQMAEKTLQEAMASEEGQALWQRWEHPMVQESLALLQDMHSHEFFVVGDKAWADLLRVYFMLDTASDLGTFLLLRALPEDAEEVGVSPWLGVEFTNKVVAAFMERRKSLLRVPSLLCGWRVKSLERAQMLINMLRGGIGVLGMTTPQLAGRIESLEVAGGDFTLVRLSGNDVPWEELFSFLTQLAVENGAEWGAEPEEEQEGDISQPKAPVPQIDVPALVEHLKTLQLVIALGMREDWVLFGFGPDLRFLELPPEGQRLADRREFAQVAARATGKIISHLFIDKEVTGYSRSYTEGLSLCAEVLKSSSEFTERLSDEDRQQFLDRIEELREFFEKWQQSPVEVASVLFRTDRGLEEIALIFGTGRVPSSGALQLLAAAGPRPVVVAVSRIPRRHFDYFYSLSRWAFQYFPVEGLLELTGREEVDKAELRNFMDRMWLLSVDVDRVIQQYLIPGLGDWELGYVCDAQLQVSQLAPQLPTVSDGLPLPEQALVVIPADRDKLVQGFGHLKELWERLKGVLADSPNIGPPVEELEDFPILIDWEERPWGWLGRVSLSETDIPLTPVVAVGQKMIVFSVSSSQAERLLAGQPVAPIGLIQDIAKPREWVIIVDGARIAEALRPWAKLLHNPQVLEEAGLPDDLRDLLTAVSEDWETVEQILRCFVAFTAEEVQETPELRVRRTCLELRDLPPEYAGSQGSCYKAE